MTIEAVHHGLDRLHRVDLGDDTFAPMPLARIATPRPTPAVAGDDEELAGEEHVGRADDAVERGLTRAVAVVEEVLRLRLVDRDDREGELAVPLERLQPDHARGGLLGAGDHVAELLAAGGVEDADHVGAVVHRDVRLVVDRRLDVLVVRVVVLALDREGRDAVLVDERGGDVVLRRQRVGGADDDVGATRLKRAHQVRSLGGHVQAGRDPVAGERLLGLEALADRGEHRHLPVGPLDPAYALGGEARSFTSYRLVVAINPFPRSGSSVGGQATSSRSCLRCSQSTQSADGSCRAASLDRGPEIGLAAQPGGEGELVELDGEALAQVAERAELVQLAEAVEPVAGRVRSGTTSDAASR